MSIYAKEYLDVNFDLDMFARTYWDTKHQYYIYLMDRAVKRFCKTKITLPLLWNTSDHVKRFDIILGHIPGKKFAADFLSRTQQGETNTPH